MKVSVILGHPQPGSFNHAIAEAAVRTLNLNGHEVWFHDLYQERFDPLLRPAEITNSSPDSDVRNYCHELMHSDGIVVVHPNWWDQPPAVLKGWLDRVFRPGVAYDLVKDDQGEEIPQEVLKAQVAVVFNTCNTPVPKEPSVHTDPLKNLWKGVFRFCGVSSFERKMFGVVVTSTLEERSEWLNTVGEVIQRRFPRT